MPARDNMMDIHWEIDSIGVLNDALLRLYATASEDRFCIRAHAAFELLFPNACISYDEIFHHTGAVVNVIDKPLPIPREDFIKRWRRWSAEHPGIMYLRKGGTRTVFQISDFLTRREFRETAFYNEFWRLLKVRHQISAIIPIPDRLVAISINSSAAFTTQDIQVMTLMQPHFARAYWISRIMASRHPDPFEIFS